MNVSDSLDAFVVGTVLAVGLALATVLLLRKALLTLLVELCGSPGRAVFWLGLVSLTIVLTSLLGLLISFPMDDAGWKDHPHVPGVVSAFRTSVLFVLLTLGALAFVLMAGIGAHERRERLGRTRTAASGPPV
jgi:hypothetical protein